MKFIAITTIPTGVNQKKNGLRFLDATFCDNEQVLEQFNSGFIDLPNDLMNDIGGVQPSPDEETVSYATTAKKFMEFLNDIDTEYEDVSIVLNNDDGWLNAFLAYNEYRPIELTIEGEYRNVIDFNSWSAGIELSVPSKRVKFENSHDLAEAFLNKNEEALSYRQKIEKILNDVSNVGTTAREWCNELAESFFIVFMVGVFCGHVLI